MAIILIKNEDSKNETSTDTTPTGQTSYIDAHAHAIPNNLSLDNLITYLDQYSVSKVILMQTPVPADESRNNSKPESFFIPKAAEEYPDRFGVLYQGEAFILLSESVQNNSLEKEETFKELIRQAAESKKYLGFGELVIRHFPQPDIQDPKEKQSRDITVPGDHPWMLALSDLAAQYNLPLDIHIEPNNETLPGFEKLIAHNSKTKIIFDHAGWYNTGEATPELFDNLMGKYPNLYSTIKLRDPKSDEQKKVRILDENNKIVPAWLTVFQKYPDRFMIGTDVKFGLKTSEGDVDTQLGFPKKLLEQLPNNLAQKIATQNAQAVFNLN